MAAGDIYIRRNSSLTDTLPNEGTNLDAGWDAVSVETGNGVTYFQDRFNLQVGVYLVMYSEKFTTLDTTNNERVEIQAELICDNGQVGGFSQDFIRKASGQQECNLNGSMIINSTVSPTSVFTRFYRTDNSVSGTISRVPNIGSVMIVQLDSADAFGLYRASASQDITATESLINFNTNVRQDSGINRTGNQISISDPGRYLATYSYQFSETATGREDVTGRITNNGTEIVGTNGYCYLRGGDGCQDGAVTWIGVLDLPAGSLLDVRSAAPQAATLVVPSNNATFHIWKIPNGETAIREATTGDYNAAADFAWDTTKQLSAPRFAVPNAQSITTNEADYCLVFATFHQDAPDTPQRAYPEVRVRVDGVLSNTSSAGMYHRNSGGSGVVAVTVNDLVRTDINSEIRINTTPTAATGALNNDSGQFSVLSLTSLYGAYSFPPTITQLEDGRLSVNELDVDIDGSRFGAIQGSGKVEISNSADYSIGPNILQTVNSWSDNLININTITDAVDEGQAYLFVTNDDGLVSLAFSFSLGLLTYPALISDSNPDHWWRFDGAYDDSAGNNPFTVSPTGTNGFASLPISESTAQSWRVQTGRRECPNSSNMNLPITTNRLMGGWVRLGGIQKGFSCIYEEGGSINNLAFFLGINNTLIAQLADTGDDNVQVFSSISLEPNRNYHILFKFSYTDGSDKFTLYLDGIEQPSSSGNPLTASDLDAHSGDISIGGGGGNLEVGGTDIRFVDQENTYYGDWVTYSDETPLSLIEDLFRRGAIPTYVISGTQFQMQAQLDVLPGTVAANDPLTIRVLGSSDGAINLSLDNFTFNALSTIHLEYRGLEPLNITNLNGSNLVFDKVYATQGATVNIINPVDVTLTGLQPNTEIRLYEAGTINEVAGVENSGTSETFGLLGVTSVDIRIFNVLFKNVNLFELDTTASVSLPIQQQPEPNYDNP